MPATTQAAQASTIVPASPTTIVPSSTPKPDPTRVPTAAPMATETTVPSSTPKPGPTGEPTAVAALTGVYTKQLTLADAKPWHLENKDCEYVGTYTLTLTTSTWNVVQSKPSDCFTQGGVNRGSVLFQPIRVTFEDDFAMMTTNCTATHVYTWTFEKSNLVLRAVDDHCQDHVFIFTTHPWTRVQPRK